MWDTFTYGRSQNRTSSRREAYTTGVAVLHTSWRGKPLLASPAHGAWVSGAPRRGLFSPTGGTCAYPNVLDLRHPTPPSQRLPSPLTCYLCAYPPPMYPSVCDAFHNMKESCGLDESSPLPSRQCRVMALNGIFVLFPAEVVVWWFPDRCRATAPKPISVGNSRDRQAFASRTPISRLAQPCRK